MGNESGAESAADIRLLGADEPPPFRVLNGKAAAPLLLLCDHASRRIPAALGDLGLDPLALHCHLAWDIGAGALTELLAGSRKATAVLAGYSRLVVDCNRQLLDAQAFLEYGDGVIISGNRGLQAVDRDIRAREIYWPYHQAIEAQIKRLKTGGVQPAILAMHSFTPVMNGVSRPWEVGILWDKDPLVPEYLIKSLRAEGLVVGDNEPYSGRGPMDFTIDYHAESNSLPHAGVEVRQDLIGDDRGVKKMAELFERVFAGLEEHLATNMAPAAAD